MTADLFDRSIASDDENDLIDFGGSFAAIGDADWMARSLCSQTDPEAFFPEKGGSTAAAKRTCAECTVQAECLDWALANDEHYGIWGGLSERERRNLKKLMAGVPAKGITEETTTEIPAVAAAAGEGEAA